MLTCGLQVYRRRDAGATMAGGAHLTDSAIDIQGRNLKLTNLEKVLYPAAAFTKKDVSTITFESRPQSFRIWPDERSTRKRYPDGVEGEPFFEKMRPCTSPIGCRSHPSGAGATAAPSTTFWPMICPRLYGWRIWPRSNCTRRSLGRKTLRVPPKWSSISTPALRRTLWQCCQVALWLREIFRALRAAEFCEDFRV